MSNAQPSDDELAQSMEDCLDGEHKLRHVYMKATGCTYEQAKAAFIQAKALAVAQLVINASRAKDACTCPAWWMRAAKRNPAVAVEDKNAHHPTCGYILNA